MLTKKRIPLFIALVFFLEAIVYLWARWTTDPEFVLNKCARNSGRASSLIILVILLMLGYYGLKKIYQDEQKKDAFRILITLFTVNHFIHFFFVFMTFKTHALTLSILENLHGFITFIFIALIPLLLWRSKQLTTPLYILVILHLFNVVYFINQTFLSKVTPEKPAYHNQLGIVVLSAACLYVLYGIIREKKRSRIQ